jgi:hypothetical protein
MGELDSTAVQPPTAGVDDAEGTAACDSVPPKPHGGFFSDCLRKSTGYTLA